MSEATVILIAAVIAMLVIYVQWLDREREVQLHNLSLAINAIMEALEEQEKLIENLERSKRKRENGQWMNQRNK